MKSKNKNITPKQDLRNLIIVFAIVIGLFLILNYMFIQLKFEKEFGYVSYGDYLEHREDTTIWIYGHSVVRDAIDPRLIPNSFNMASSAENYRENYQKFLWNLEHDTVETIIVPVHVFSAGMTLKKDFQDLTYWNFYMSEDELIEKSGESKLRVFMEEYFPLIGNLELVPAIYNKRNLEQFKGYTEERRQFANVKDKIGEARREVKKNLGDELDEEIYEQRYGYLKTMIDHAQRENIRVIIVRYPEGTYYKQAIREYDISEDELETRIRYDYPDVEYVDLSDIEDLDDFSDFLHVNWKGSEKATLRLLEQINSKN